MKIKEPAAEEPLKKSLALVGAPVAFTV